MPNGVKRITREQVLGETTVNFIGRRFLEMGYLWHPTNAPLDAGIDGFVEIRDVQTGEATNTWIAVQSKGRSALAKETATSFEFACSPRDLDYWRRGNMPLLLVVGRPETNEAWWVSIKDYFRADPARAQSRRIIFDKAKSSLITASAAQIKELAQTAGTATYFRPAPKVEELHTNLLEVTRFPKTIYRASTSFRAPALLRDELRKVMEYPPKEWLLHGECLYSVHDLREPLWSAVCDASTTTLFDGTEWATSDDPATRRLFVWMLNDCLREFLGRMGMRYSKDEDAYFYKKTKDLLPKTKNYQSRQHRSQRVVFRAYQSKADPARIAYYRHVGFEPHFKRFDGRWCLEINPTYLFTSDGEKTHSYHQEYLSKIKTIEGSGAVGGCVFMFASLMRDRDGLFAQDDNYPHLGFGGLLESSLDVGINDKLWAQDDTKCRSESPVDESVELTAEELDSKSLTLFDGLDDAEGDA
jgi:hypothetical protein